jgi:cholesterol transport system auxiliary component
MSQSLLRVLWSTRVPLLPLVLLASTLTACGPSLLQRPAEQATHTYLLEWRGEGAESFGDPSGPSLSVSPVLSAPGFDSSDMAYMRRPYEIEYFARHRWADAPARMLDPLLVQAASHTGLFRSVAEVGAGARADLRLESRLLHLQQVCRLDPSELQLALRVNLIDVASGRVLGSRTLNVVEPITERSPYAGVEAANRAVAGLLSELQGFLVEQLGGVRRAADE